MLLTYTAPEPGARTFSCEHDDCEKACSNLWVCGLSLAQQSRLADNTGRPILMGEDRSTEDEVWQIRVIDEIITYTFQIFDDV